MAGTHASDSARYIVRRSSLDTEILKAPLISLSSKRTSSHCPSLWHWFSMGLSPPSCPVLKMKRQHYKHGPAPCSTTWRLPSWKSLSSRTIRAAPCSYHCRIDTTRRTIFARSFRPVRHLEITRTDHMYSDHLCMRIEYMYLYLSKKLVY